MTPAARIAVPARKLEQEIAELERFAARAQRWADLAARRLAGGVVTKGPNKGKPYSEAGANAIRVERNRWLSRVDALRAELIDARKALAALIAAIQSEKNGPHVD